MAEASLISRSALTDIAQPLQARGHCAVVIAECAGFNLAQVLIRKNQARRFAEQVRTHLDIDLTTARRRVLGRDTAFIWAGRDQWLITANENAGAGWFDSLTALFADTAAFSPQTDGRAIVCISGPGALDALGKICPIDLHPEVFTPDSAALTCMGHFPAHVWRLGATDAYEIAVPRSYAESFWHALLEAAAEYGCEIAPPYRLGALDDVAHRRAPIIAKGRRVP